MEHLNADRNDLLSDNGLIAIAKGCQLIEVVCSDHQSTNPAVLEAFAKHCPQLRSLSAAECVVSAAALNALATRCLSLSTLSATWAVDPKNCVVTEGLAQLETLRVRVAPTGPTEVVRALQSIASRCNALRAIALDGSWLLPSVDHSAEPVGEALVALAKANPNVTEFTLRGLSCSILGDEHMNAIAQYWPKLHGFLVGSGMTDAALSAFAQHCPGLTHVFAFGTSPSVTDRSVLMLAKHRIKLAHVDLQQAYQVTEEAFTELVRCCPQLDSLVVPITVTHEALQRIAAAKSGIRVYVTHGR